MTEQSIKQQIQALIKSSPMWTPHANNPSGVSDKDGRNQTLFDIAHKERMRGCSQEAIHAKIEEVNQERFDDPLPPSEVKQIARGVMRYTPPDSVSDLPPSIEYPVESIPEPLRTLVLECEEDMNCDASMFCTPLMAAAGSLIGNTAGVQMRRTWLASPNLWFVLIAPSGSMKSPALDISVRFLKRIESKLAADNHKALKRYQKEYRQYMSLPPKERAQIEEPKKPVPRRVLLNDATVEALQTVHHQNPRGLMVFCDEFCVVADGMGRYSSTPTAVEGIYLQMQSNGQNIVDRSDPTKDGKFIDRAALSMTGGTQPAIFKETMRGRRIDSGFCPRLLVAMPDVRPKRWAEERLQTQTLDEVQKVFDKLFEIPLPLDQQGHPEPVVVRLNSEAMARWGQWYNDFNLRAHSLPERLRAVDSKLEGYVPRIALIIHMIKAVAGIAPIASKTEISLDTLEDAINIVEWHRHEGQRVYRMLDDDQTHSVQESLVGLITRKFNRAVTAGELARNTGRFSKKSSNAKAALDELVEAGLGVWRDRPSGTRGGRPTQEFVLSASSSDGKGFVGSVDMRPTPCQVNPRVRDAWASAKKKYQASNN